MSEVQEVKTIGEVERIVHASGLWDGASAVEFSNDGETWAEHWAPTEEHPYPTFARVETYRKDVRLPARVTARWDEQIPQDPEWHQKWCTHQMQHFGRTVRMLAFRQAFRDLLGNIRLEDEAIVQDTDTQRDWAAEFKTAESVDALVEVWEAARAVRALNAELEVVFRGRRRELGGSKPKVGLRVAAKVAAPVDEQTELDEALERLQEHYAPARPSPAMFAGKKR